MERDGRPTFGIVMSENHFGTKLKIGYKLTIQKLLMWYYLNWYRAIAYRGAQKHTQQPAVKESNSWYFYDCQRATNNLLYIESTNPKHSSSNFNIAHIIA